MRNRLPKRSVAKECAVVNLDDFNGAGTHWVAYYKNKSDVFYFDSFGNLRPPQELLNYFGNSVNVYYNYKRYQEFGSVICGQLCIQFLYEIYDKFSRNEKYHINM